MLRSARPLLVAGALVPALLLAAAPAGATEPVPSPAVTAQATPVEEARAAAEKARAAADAALVAADRADDAAVAACWSGPASPACGR